MKKSNKLLDFLFGKDADIFNDDGHVEHKLPQAWWNSWEDRFREPEFLWRHHKGLESKKETPMKEKNKNK